MTRQFKLHLPGLLSVLSENLYSTKKVAIRELLQNAHDGTVRRRVQVGDALYAPRVVLTIDEANSRLTISDNGFGLTEEEVVEYLATIGRSYTAEFREKLTMLASDDASALIGQFGLGFLSAFLIASEIEVITRSFGGDGGAVRFHCFNDGSYETAPAQRAEAGTTVELVIKPEAQFLLQQGTLIRTIQRYADFLPVPVYLNGDPAPINQGTPPWMLPDPVGAARAYIERVYESEPLAIIPLEPATADLGHDTLEVQLHGFLFIPQSSFVSLREYGEVAVYIRRMFITERYPDLLPAWARFVQGVIDCPELQPTASREDLHEDETLQFVRQAIEKQLLAGLKRIATSEPRTWAQIVYGHTGVITAWAVKDSEFFGHVADLVRFPTSRGNLTLPEYLKQSGNTIYYASRKAGSLQEQVLAEGQGVPVIDASWSMFTPFLEKYAQVHRNVDLVQVDGDGDEFMRPVDSAAYAILLDYFKKRDIKVVVAAFKPDSVPALMRYPRDAEFVQDARSALDAGEIPSGIAGLISDYVNRRDSRSVSGTLYLNASCALIEHLSQPETPADKRDMLLGLVYQFARLFAGRTLNAADATGAYQEVVDHLLKLGR